MVSARGIEPLLDQLGWPFTTWTIHPHWRSFFLRKYRLFLQTLIMNEFPGFGVVDMTREPGVDFHKNFTARA